ncbi:kinase-like domain-containing protein [Phaeosphaeriaceae sp. PMI808]|nr:kinase-like domain-containing protein [Phaeosphaeriaceae sp. PMI808]
MESIDTVPKAAQTDSNIAIDDWSQTGRGFHVDFKPEEIVPLAQGRYLGRGSMGDVYETTVQGWKLAHKRIEFKRKIGEKEMKEIAILKRLSSHNHIIQLVGTYTHRRLLGILLYPVAVCDLHKFFDDVEAWSTIGAESHTKSTRLEALDSFHKDRLTALAYDFPEFNARNNATIIYSKLGCLVSAISYLHDQKIRHKDIKPSNILLSPDRLWLSDFGSATDFSLLSQSATDNERGTARYFSPEVAAWKSVGRAADIFSLGCVLLEIVVLHERGTLSQIRDNRSRDPSFHANLSHMSAWCSLREPVTIRRYHLMIEIRRMLTEDSAMRPSAEQVLIRLIGYDLSTKHMSTNSIFGDCCKRLLVSAQQYETDKLKYENTINEQALKLNHAFTEANSRKTEIDHLVATNEKLKTELAKERDARRIDKGKYRKWLGEHVKGGLESRTNMKPNDGREQEIKQDREERGMYIQENRSERFKREIGEQNVLTREENIREPLRKEREIEILIERLKKTIQLRKGELEEKRKLEGKEERRSHPRDGREREIKQEIEREKNFLAGQNAIMEKRKALLENERLLVAIEQKLEEEEKRRIHPRDGRGQEIKQEIEGEEERWIHPRDRRGQEIKQEIEEEEFF